MDAEATPVSSLRTGALTADEIQIWHFILDVDAGTQVVLARLLNDDERQRAKRFRFEEHHRRFIVRRGVLRLILAHYTRMAPEAICFTSNATGKPGLDSPAAVRALKFSGSSSQAFGAVALAYDRELGLDLEQVRPDRDHALIAGEFSVHEAAWLRRLEPERRKAAFFDLWTCKEAYLKGKGLGLSVPLDQFTIAIDSASPRLTWSALDVADPDLWSLYRLNLDPGFAACLAVAGGCQNIRCDRYIW